MRLFPKTLIPEINPKHIYERLTNEKLTESKKIKTIDGYIWNQWYERVIILTEDSIEIREKYRRKKDLTIHSAEINPHELYLLKFHTDKSSRATKKINIEAPYILEDILEELKPTDKKLNTPYRLAKKILNVYRK